MVQFQRVTRDAEVAPQPIKWFQTRNGNRLDCETAALLRQVVTPIFVGAQTWQDLRSRLRTAGYDIVFEGPRLVLIETMQGSKICSCRFLGYPLHVLAHRFGKLRVRPALGRNAYGQALI